MINKLHELLIPVDIKEPLKRYGKRPHDGGYVLSPSELAKTNIIYSYGVGSRWRPMHFDLHMDELDKTVYLYDGSIGELPGFTKDIDNFIFKSLNINSENIIEELSANNHLGLTNLAAKMDIEGAEYEVFSKCDDLYFKTFSQIVVEFHDLLDFSQEKKEALARLNERYYIFHMHANNYAEVKDRYPSVVEVSYIRKSSLNFEPKPRLAGYPVKNLDVKNRPRSPEVSFNWWS